MRVIAHRILCLAVVCLLLGSCASMARMTSKDYVFTPPAPADAAERACLAFVQNRLSQQGGIYTNYLGGSVQGELAQGHEVLGESQGLMLRYYAATADEQGFSQTLDYIRQKMDTGVLLSYRLLEDGSHFPTNAAIDDLRIYRGLLEGALVFSKPEYRVLCQNWAQRLYQTNVADGILLDCYDETLFFAGHISTLCFSDLETMQWLGAIDKRWYAVEKKMLGILKKGYLGNDFPFFYTRYDSDSGTYGADRINMVEALLTALHLSQVGQCPETTVRWVKQALDQEAIYGEYTLQGAPASAVESTAIYALCALLGDAEGDRALMAAAMDKMRTLQIDDSQNVLYGAFADTATLQAYSFDNLMALTALRTRAQRAAAGGKGAGA